jgi:hypothetical protein
VRRGDIVLLRTDWPRRMGVDKEQFWKEGPWTGPSACEWLVARGAKAVGYDYPPDHCIRDTVAEPRRRPARAEYTTHAIFFPAGITVIEYLTNLDQIGAARCRFMALPLKTRGRRRLAGARHRARGVAPARREMLDPMIDLRLAPMAAVTNAPFRLIARECGAGRLTSEEIDARGLVEGSARTASWRAFCPRSTRSRSSSWAPTPTCSPKPRAGSRPPAPTRSI